MVITVFFVHQSSRILVRFLVDLLAWLGRGSTPPSGRRRRICSIFSPDALFLLACLLQTFDAWILRGHFLHLRRMSSCPLQVLESDSAPVTDSSTRGPSIQLRRETPTLSDSEVDGVEDERAMISATFRNFIWARTLITASDFSSSPRSAAAAADGGAASRKVVRCL